VPIRALRSVDPAAVATRVVAATLVGYLALNNGGYDVIERSQAGILVWWIVVVATAIGALPVAGGAPAGRAMLAVLAAFAAWTALSLGWTESQERTWIELGRVAAYLGFFALALGLTGTGRWRQVLDGAAIGLGAVVAIAVLSRLEPTWFPERVSSRFLATIEIERRLAYPLNYSSGLAALAALSLPLLLAASSYARTLPVQALAAAALPVAGLALWLTGSGQTTPLAVLGLVVFVALAPDRLPKLATLLVAAAGTVILCAIEVQLEALDRGLPTPAAQREGDELLVIVIVVCAAVALAQAALTLALRRTRPGWLRVRPVETGIALALVALVAVVAGAPGALADRWEEFKDREGVPASAGRAEAILDPSGTGRYQFWESAQDANASDPWIGIGPGTFEFWWSRNGSYGGFVRDAHSLYMETLAELGIVGFALIVGFVAGVLGIGAWRSLRSPPDLRLGLAAATAAGVVFAATAGVDWNWELGVLPAAFVVVAAVATAGREGPARGPRSALESYGTRAVLVAGGAAAMVVILVPLSSEVAVERSRDDAANGDIAAALDEARAAEDVLPAAATPRLQQALLLERLGDYEQAIDAAREATDREPTNWRMWLILSRLEARDGDAAASLRAHRRARSLNPRAPTFAR
jgi:hypothetical protein